MDEAHNIEPLTPPGPNVFGAPASGQEYNAAAATSQTSQKSSTQAEDEDEAEAGFVLGYN